MRYRNLLTVTTAFLIAIGPKTALSEIKTYQIDPLHTFPAFEADHMGLSMWRGKINSTEGLITFDDIAKVGSVDILMDMRSIDFGLEDMNEHAKSDEILNVEKYPQARYVGDLIFNEGKPTHVDGELTLHGVTRAVTLKIVSFKCILHPTKYIDSCGAEALASINRAEFGVDYAKKFGFAMNVDLRIGVEASEIAAKEKSVRVFFD